MVVGEFDHRRKARRCVFRCSQRVESLDPARAQRLVERGFPRAILSQRLADQNRAFEAGFLPLRRQRPQRVVRRVVRRIPILAFVEAALELDAPGGLVPNPIGKEGLGASVKHHLGISDLRPLHDSKAKRRRKFEVPLAGADRLLHHRTDGVGLKHDFAVLARKLEPKHKLKTERSEVLQLHVFARRIEAGHDPTDGGHEDLLAGPCALAIGDIAIEPDHLRGGEFVGVEPAALGQKHRDRLEHGDSESLVVSARAKVLGATGHGANALRLYRGLHPRIHQVDIGDQRNHLAVPPSAEGHALGFDLQLTPFDETAEELHPENAALNAVAHRRPFAASIGELLVVGARAAERTVETANPSAVADLARKRAFGESSDELAAKLGFGLALRTVCRRRLLEARAIGLIGSEGASSAVASRGDFNLELSVLTTNDGAQAGNRGDARGKHRATRGSMAKVRHRIHTTARPTDSHRATA